MLAVAVGCLVLLVTTFVMHYEVLGLLSTALPRPAVQGRLKVMFVVFVTFAAHAVQILLYALAYYSLVTWFGSDVLHGLGDNALMNCIYFSAETFTSLGYGDILPVGPPRLLVGVEALNGLLLIGWSASYYFVMMERFWGPSEDSRNR